MPQRPKILFILFFLLAKTYCVAQAPPSCGAISLSALPSVKQEVQRIFDKTLKAMESTAADGTKMTTWSGWDSADKEQIKCLGAVAVPFITELLSSDRTFGQLLSVKMLGWAGGKEIIPPLFHVLKESKSSTIRNSAVEALGSAPLQNTLPILEWLAKSDPDPNIRKRAATLLKKS